MTTGSSAGPSGVPEQQPTSEGQKGSVLTIGELRDVIKHLHDDVPLSIAVRDQHHFNTLLGELPVVGASVTRGPVGSVVVLDVADVT